MMEKKTFFSPGTSRNIEMAMNKLPKPYKLLYDAIKTYDTRSLFSSNVDTLLDVWPKDANISDMEHEILADGESWAKAEAYFVKLVEPSDLQQRLSLWQWKHQLQENVDRINGFYLEISEIYSIINTDPNFLKLLGYILRIGNILNGGTNNGQADGFDLAVIGKCHTFRDNNKQSVLEYVCKKLKDKDAEFPDAMKRVYKKMQSRNTDMETLKTMTSELSGKMNQASAYYQIVIDSQNG